MWKIYDELIEGIDENIIADDIIAGHQWTHVRSGDDIGMCAIYPVETRLPLYSENFIGKPLKEIAKCIKSWNFIEASVGGAAINAYYNSVSMAKKNNIELSKSRHFDDRLNDPFITYQQQVKGKNVAVIGHFPYLETLFQPVCNLSIIETDPLDGDYPFYAIEYLLPDQDFVFITASSILNKTLPRLLELSKNAYKVMVGPSTTLSPSLFNHGINDLSGFVVKDPELARRILSGAQNGSLYSTGQKVHWIN